MVVEWGMSDLVNPVLEVRRPKRPEGRLRLLTKMEARILLDVACESENKALHPWILLQLHSGMRPSEGAGLTWGQVDFAGGMLVHNRLS